MQNYFEVILHANYLFVEMSHFVFSLFYRQKLYQGINVNKVVLILSYFFVQ